MGSGAHFVYFLQRRAGLYTLVLLLWLKAMPAIKMEKMHSIWLDCGFVITDYTSKTIKLGKWQSSGLVILALLVKYTIKSKTNTS